MQKIKLTVFDMAGTVVDEDNVVYKTLHKSIVDAGHPCTLEDVLLHGSGKEKRQAIEETLAAKGLRGDVETIFSYFQKTLDDAYANVNVKGFAGVEKVFEELHQKGIKVTFNTGYNRKIATLLLKKLGWQEGREYDALVTTDEAEKSRPAPDMILLAMEKTGITESKVVLKGGDSAIDIEEGKNAGCGITVGVTTGAQTREQLMVAEPTYVFDSLSELLDIV